MNEFQKAPSDADPDEVAKVTRKLDEARVRLAKERRSRLIYRSQKSAGTIGSWRSRFFGGLVVRANHAALPLPTSADRAPRAKAPLRLQGSGEPVRARSSLFHGVLARR